MTTGDWKACTGSAMGTPMSIATPIAEGTRLNHVQALRGLAALLVLLAHMAQVEIRGTDRTILPESFDWGMMGVDLFFVISGFIMVFVTRNWRENHLHDRLARVGEFLFARVTRIYPLYWIVTLALFMVWMLRPDMVFSSSPNEPQIFNTVFLVPAYAYPLLEVGWTLVYEMGFYLLFGLLLLAPARWRPWGLLAWAAITLTGNLSGWQTGSAIAFHAFNPLVFEFLAGAATGLIFLRIKGDRIYGAILLAIGLAGLFMWFFSAVPFQDGWPRVLCLTLPSCAVLLGAAWMDRAGLRAPRFMVHLGDWSYALYLTHLLTLVLVARLWRKAGLEDVPSIVLLVVMGVAAILVAALTYRLIERPLLTLAKASRKRLFKERPSAAPAAR
ncbi:exopolysaccharide production protein ExoZ [Algimonas porphyrae]|uniref:Exopolysaccharide production protein ExoZ n=2 Tax=Algimonas porphyrae TaxID=1128113 RepID=A0ABQ5V4S1_9PROT|nr:exopolysaccharide production protein ExoZ [Algimonas porphyrae]